MTTWTRPWQPTAHEKLELDWAAEKERMADLVRAVSFLLEPDGVPPRISPAIQAPLVASIHAALDREDPEAFAAAVCAWRQAWHAVIDSAIDDGQESL